MPASAQRQNGTKTMFDGLFDDLESAPSCIVPTVRSTRHAPRRLAGMQTTLHDRNVIAGKFRGVTAFALVLTSLRPTSVISDFQAITRAHSANVSYQII